MAQKLNIDIVARDKSKQALNGVQKSLGRLKQSIFNLQNAFIGLGAGLVIRNLVNTGKNLENLRVRLKFLLKDTNEGEMLVNEIKKFLPESKIKYVTKNDDPRDYRVNCDKIKKVLDFKISMTVPDGIKEIIRVIQENLIKDPENQKYYNIPHGKK